jgi:membrane associated rhomboid family serine protease
MDIISANFLTPTYILIGITVAISLLAFNNPKLMQDLIMNPYIIHTRKQYYRFLTSGFIHKDHMHLLFNMLSLYFFGSAMEMVFGVLFEGMGTVYYLALYLLGIVVSDLPTFFKHKHHPVYNALGASGGVAAVIFAFIIFLPLERICLYFALCIPGFILGTVYVVYSWYQGRKANDNINHDAHLWGAAFGLVFCMVLYPPAIGNFFAQIAGWDWKLF